MTPPSRLPGALLLGAALLVACPAEQPTPAEKRVDNASEATAKKADNPHRIDRIGRMEITNTYLRAHKESYNREDPFNLEVSHLEFYEQPLNTNLNLFDLMDGVNDWTPDGGQNPLTRVLLQDFLLVDVSKPCTVDSHSYLEIERAILRHEDDYDTCGGRTPNDTALDRMLTLLVNGPDRPLPWRTDGVKAATKPSVNTFPYLAPPNLPDDSHQ